MRTRSLVVGVLLWALAAAEAGAISLRDVVELSRAGLGDEVIVALIEIDPIRYDLDAPKLLELQAAGVSERVLVALVRSGRPEPASSSLEPQRSRAPRPSTPAQPPVMAAMPSFPIVVGVPLPATLRRRHGVGSVAPPRRSGFGTHLFFGPVVGLPAPAPGAEPVYWGWGGERRPDTWDPPRSPASDPR